VTGHRVVSSGSLDNNGIHRVRDSFVDQKWCFPTDTAA